MPYKDKKKQKKYQQGHYRRNRKKYLARIRRRAETYRRIITVAKTRPCSDCGQSYPPYVMDFHHRNPRNKKFSIGHPSWSPSVARLLAEMAKCDLICSNCHREREYGGN